jgi:hypothetical protein
MTKATGFHISLSGGKNSCAVALIIYNMCCLLFDHIVNRNCIEVLVDLRKVLRDEKY